MAQEAFESESARDQAWAARLWTRAAELYEEERKPFQAAEAWDDAGQARLALGETEEALAAFGAAIVQRRRTAMNMRRPLSDFAKLANRSPVLTPSTADFKTPPDSTAEFQGGTEASEFVKEVREIIADTPAGEEVASDINSAREATIALEALMSSSFTKMKVRADTSGVPVKYRRWIHRNNPNVPWHQVYADTTVEVVRAAYQIRFRIPGTQRDTTIVRPCASGCTQYVPTSR